MPYCSSNVRKVTTLPPLLTVWKTGNGFAIPVTVMARIIVEYFGMSEIEYSQTHPTSDDILDMRDDLRRCALCPHPFPKDEMVYLQLDEPGHWQWVCWGCHEQIQ